MEKNYVLKSVVRGQEVYFDRLSATGCPLNDELRGARRYTQGEAIREAARLNAFMRQWPDFKEDWLYRVERLPWQFHIETYTMPAYCDAWQTEQRLEPQDDEGPVLDRWEKMVREVERDYPQATVRRRLDLRTVEQAMGDRESAICSREWTLPGGEGCYRVTMYVTRKAA